MTRERREALARCVTAVERLVAAELEAGVASAVAGDALRAVKETEA